MHQDLLPLNSLRFPACRLTMTLLVMLIAGKCIVPAAAGPQQPPNPVPAPGAVQPPPTTTEIQRLAQSLPTDRKTILTLDSCRQQIAAGRWGVAVEEIRRLQTADPETMVPAGVNSTTFIPLYRAAFDYWLSLPRQARQQLSEHNESAAKKSLARVLESGRMELLPKLILESIGTTASIDAHLIAARLHLDRGNTLAARVWLEPLQHQGVDTEVRATVNRALNDFSTVDDPQQVESVDSGLSPRPLPRHLQWQYRPLASPQLQRQIDTFIKAAMSSKVVLQSTCTEQLDGTFSFRKTMRGVAAIDLSIGKSVWEYPLAPGLDASVTANSANNSLFQRIRADSIPAGIFTNLDQTAIANSFCRNEVLGNVTIDADRIYLIDGDASGRVSTKSAARGLFASPTGRQTVRGVRLMALEKATGRRVWTVSAASIRDAFKTGSQQFWMAGPPTVSNGKLYGVVEWNGEIHVVCFEPRTGEVKWTKVLAFPEQTIDKDPVRQLRGARPKAQSGLIWCPTTTDRIVCVDELTRSVVWAGHLPVNTEKHNGVSSSRGRPVSLTAAAAIIRRWPRSEVINAGDNLAVFSSQSHEVFTFNAITGAPGTPIPVERGSVVAHADASLIVIAGPERVFSLNPFTGQQKWSFEFDARAGLPVGRGLLRGSRLLMPMSNGNLLSLNAVDGTLIETAENVLPKGAWGQLLNVDAASGDSGDLLYAAPERLVRISSAPPATEPQNALELAAGLMASGKWSQAIEVAAQVDSAHPGYREAQGIRFNCLLQLAIDSPETHLAELKEAEATTEQQTQVRFLEVNTLLKSGETKPAALRLIEVLKLDPVLAAVPAPVAALQRNTVSSPDHQIQVTLPLRTWAGVELSRLLPELADDTDVQQQLSSLPATALLSLTHPSMRTLLQAYAEAESSAETALHLLRHSVQLATLHGMSVDDEVRVLSDLLRKYSTSTPLAIDVRRIDLLNVALHEFPEAVVRGLLNSNAAEFLVSRSVMNEEFRETLLRQSGQWTPQPFHVIPVTGNTPTSRRNSVMLSTAVLDDPFLRRFQWTATPGDFGRLIAKDDTQQWSVPGTFKVYGNYSNRTDMLYRFGSVILLRSFSSIAAISVLDRRVIWSRDFQTRDQTFSAASQNESFQQFDGSRHRLPSENHYLSSPAQLVAAGHRWLCLKHDGKVEMIDTLLGAAAWSARLSDPQSRVIATDDVVVIAPPQTPAICLRRGTGEVVLLPHLHDLPARTLRNVGSQLVCWKAGSDGRANSVEWLDSQSGEAVRVVHLEDMTDFQLLDDTTLVGLNDKRQMTVVDLVSGNVQVCSYQAEGDTEVSRTKGEAESGNVGSTRSLWDARRVRIAADGLNYYVMNEAQNAAQLFRQPSGRELLRFTGELRAVDRHAGRLRWRLSRDSVLLAATDQPTLPVLALVESTIDTQNAVNQPYTKNQFRAINKLTGEQLFKKTVPSRFGLRYLSLETPKPGTLDVAVYGNRMRIQGEAAVAVGDELNVTP